MSATRVTSSIPMPASARLRSITSASRWCTVTSTPVPVPSPTARWRYRSVCAPKSSARPSVMPGGEQGLSRSVHFLGGRHRCRAHRQQPGEPRLGFQHQGTTGVARDVARSHPPPVSQGRAVVVRGDQQRGATTRFGPQVTSGQFQRGEQAVAALPQLGGQDLVNGQVTLEVGVRRPPLRALLPGRGVQQQVELGREPPAAHQRAARRSQRQLRCRDFSGHGRAAELVQFGLLSRITSRPRPRARR